MNTRPDASLTKKLDSHRSNWSRNIVIHLSCKTAKGIDSTLTQRTVTKCIQDALSWFFFIDCHNVVICKGMCTYVCTCICIWCEVHHLIGTYTYLACSNAQLFMLFCFVLYLCFIVSLGLYAIINRVSEIKAD